MSEDALRSVPHALREASYGMGARKITTVQVVVPAAVSGLVAAFILAVSRAIGETMVVFIAAGAAGTSRSSSSPLEPGLTMTAAMATAGPGHRPGEGRGPRVPEPLLRRARCSSSITLMLNMVADRFVRRVRQAY